MRFAAATARSAWRSGGRKCLLRRYNTEESSKKHLLEVFATSQERKTTPEALVRAVCEYENWSVPSAASVATLEGDHEALQVALLQTAAGDSEVFIFSEPQGCLMLQQQCAGVVDFDCNTMPGHIALHAALLQYESNAELTRIRIDHGQPHSFTIEREALPLLEHYASCVMVEKELARLEGTPEDQELLCNVEAVLDFDFHVLSREGQGGVMQLLPLGEVSGNADQQHMAAAWTAPDHLEGFLASDGLVVREDMQMAKMKGTALFQMMQIEQTNSGVGWISFNPSVNEIAQDPAQSTRALIFETSAIARIGLSN